MQKYCEHCGSLLDTDTGLCPECDRGIIFVMKHAKPVQVQKQEPPAKAYGKFRPLVIVLILALLAGCTWIGVEQINTRRQVSRDLSSTLTAVRRGSLSKSDMYLVGDPAQLRGNSPYAEKFVQHMNYHIESISVKEDNAEAKVMFECPDALKLMEQTAEHMPTATLEQFLTQVICQMDIKYPTREFATRLNLVRKDNHWYLIPSGELQNALSGGLLEAYANMGLDVIQQLGED